MQQRPAQSHYGIFKAFMIKLILMIFSWLNSMFTDRLHRKSTHKKKIQKKLGTGY